MTAATLAAAVVDQPFPAGTADAPFDYTVTGTLADGTAFALTQASGSFDLAPGTYTGVVSKTVAGATVSSLPSSPLVIPTAATVTLSVPDGTMAAALTSP
jgi:hypothetical protein